MFQVKNKASSITLYSLSVLTLIVIKLMYSSTSGHNIHTVRLTRVQALINMIGVECVMKLKG